MQIKKLIVIILAIITTSAFAAMPHDYPNQPDGFRNVPWGSDLRKTEGMKKLFVSDDDKDTAYYERSSDKLEIGAAKLKSIGYSAWKNKCTFVMILFKGHANYEALKASLFEKFGEGKKHDHRSDNFGWFGDKTNIILEFNDIASEGSLRFYGNEIYKEADAYRKEKAKGGQGF